LELPLTTPVPGLIAGATFLAAMTMKLSQLIAPSARQNRIPETRRSAEIPWFSSGVCFSRFSNVSEEGKPTIFSESNRAAISLANRQSTIVARG
jgi:hypothetical protein